MFSSLIGALSRYTTILVKAQLSISPPVQFVEDTVKRKYCRISAEIVCFNGKFTYVLHISCFG